MCRASSPSPPTPRPASGGRTDCALDVQQEQQAADSTSHAAPDFTNASHMVRTMLLTNWAWLMLAFRNPLRVGSGSSKHLHKVGSVGGADRRHSRLPEPVHGRSARLHSEANNPAPPKASW